MTDLAGGYGIMRNDMNYRSTPTDMARVTGGDLYPAQLPLYRKPASVLPTGRKLLTAASRYRGRASTTVKAILSGGRILWSKPDKYGSTRSYESDPTPVTVRTSDWFMSARPEINHKISDPYLILPTSGDLAFGDPLYSAVRSQTDRPTSAYSEASISEHDPENSPTPYWKDSVALTDEVPAYLRSFAAEGVQLSDYPVTISVDHSTVGGAYDVPKISSGPQESSRLEPFNYGESGQTFNLFRRPVKNWSGAGETEHSRDGWVKDDHRNFKLSESELLSVPQSLIVDHHNLVSNTITEHADSKTSAKLISPQAPQAKEPDIQHQGATPKVNLAASKAASPSDSGYHSGLGTDTESVCSLDSLGTSLGVSQDFLQDFIAAFGDTLMEKAGAHVWMAPASARYLPEVFEEQVNEMLKQYSLSLALTTSNQQESHSPQNTSDQVDSIEQHLKNNATKLVRRYRPKISRYVRESVSKSPQPFQSMTSRLQELGKQLSLNEKLGLLTKKDSDPDDHRDIENTVPDDFEEGSETESEGDLNNLVPITDFLLAGQAFKDLCVRFRTLYFDGMGAINYIRQQIAAGVSDLSRFCGNCRSSHALVSVCPNHEIVCHVQFSMAWKLQEFLRSQYTATKPRVGSVVILTGSALYAQAATLSRYLETVWPKNAPMFLQALQAGLDSCYPKLMPSAKVSNVNNNILFELYDSPEKLDLCHVSGSETFVTEIAQMLALTGAACSASPHKENLSYCTAQLEVCRPMHGRFSISFHCDELDSSEKSCWLGLFCGASIARNFPIPKREDELGVEIPLEMMAALAGIRHAVEYKGGVLMKGFSRMFVPVKKNQDRVQWHMICSHDDDTRISYDDVSSRCPSRAGTKDVDLSTIQNSRAIVGWCCAAWSALGSAEVDYPSVDYSSAQGSSAGLKFSGGSFGFQQFGLAQFDFTLGAKDGKCHFQRTGGPYQRIVSVADRSPVVLHDTLERRAWLVPASEVMLHMVHHRHTLEPFEINSVPLKLLSTHAEGASAKKILLESANMDLSDLEVYKYKDMITSIWSLLEYLIDQRIFQDQVPGANIPTKMQDVVHGFEYKAVVQEKSPFRQKQMSVLKTNGGWPNLVKDIDALILFASGFGDVIRQVRGHIGNRNSCHMWSTMPKEKDYLATCIKTINELYESSGYRFDRTFLTSTQLRWHKGRSALFEPCKNPGTYICNCSRLQQIVPKSVVGEIIPPGSLVEGGAVIFGRSESAFCDLRSVASISKVNGIYSQANSPFNIGTATTPEKDQASSSVESEDEDTAYSSSKDTPTSTSWTSYNSGDDIKDAESMAAVEERSYLEHKGETLKIPDDGALAEDHEYDHIDSHSSTTPVDTPTRGLNFSNKNAACFGLESMGHEISDHPSLSDAHVHHNSNEEDIERMLMSWRRALRDD